MPFSLIIKIFKVGGLSSTNMKVKYDDIVMKNVAKEIRKLGSGSLTLLDIGSDEEHLKELLPENIKYFSLDYKGNHDYVRDLDKPPLKIKEKFDIIVALEVLEHTQKPAKVMEELLNLAKPNSTFFLSMPNEYNFYNRINFVIGRKTSVQEPFKVVEKHLHIHQPRVKDILNFFSSYISIEKSSYCWYSRTSEHGKGINKNIFRAVDKIINGLSSVSPSLFTRNVLVMGHKKTGPDGG